MDWANITIALCTILATVISIVSILNKKFEKLEQRLNNLDNRVSRIEGKIDHLEGMMQTIVGFLLGHKTGSQDK